MDSQHGFFSREWYLGNARHHKTMMLHYFRTAIWKEFMNKHYGARFHWKADIKKMENSASSYLKSLSKAEIAKD